jgi:hypothetical protein
VSFFASRLWETSPLAKNLLLLHAYQAFARSRRLPPLAAMDEVTTEPSPSAVVTLLQGLPAPLASPVIEDTTGRSKTGTGCRISLGLPWSTAGGHLGLSRVASALRTRASDCCPQLFADRSEPTPTWGGQPPRRGSRFIVSRFRASDKPGEGTSVYNGTQSSGRFAAEPSGSPICGRQTDGPNANGPGVGIGDGPRSRRHRRALGAAWSLSLVWRCEMSGRLFHSRQPSQVALKTVRRRRRCLSLAMAHLVSKSGPPVHSRSIKLLRYPPPTGLDGGLDALMSRATTGVGSQGSFCG